MRTRAQLLDAAVDCLADVGYANTSTAAVANRAGLTRGAHVHHFRTRTELFAQAIDHLETLQRDAAHEAIETSPSAGPADLLVDAVAAAFFGRLGRASVELFVAVRNDDALNEHMLRSQSSLTRDILRSWAKTAGTDIPRERQETAFWLTINQIRGVAVDDMVGRDPKRPERLLAEWRRLVALVLKGA